MKKQIRYKGTFYIFCFLLILCFCLAGNGYAQKNLSKTYKIPAGQSKLLSHRLKHVKKGDTVLLGGGVYEGNFEISTSIKLTAIDKTILTSNKAGTILRIHAPNTQIDNITFRNSGTNIVDKDSCIFIESKAGNVEIKNNKFLQCEFGIWVNGSPDNLIYDNYFSGTMQRIVSDRGNGIYLYFTHGTIVKNNELTKGRDGIYISNSKNVLIKNNKMHDTRFGVHYMYSDDCKVIGNTTTNSNIGAAIMYSKRLHITNNILKNNKGHGLLLRDVLYSEIIGNSSERNGDGIYLGSSYYNLIRNNHFVRNTIAAQVSNGSKDNDVYNNNFIKNKLQVKFLDSKSIIWSGYKRGNYWSHYVGLDRNRDGIGDKEFYVTNVVDWLAFSFPVLKIILHSPAMLLLQRIENQFPVVRRAAIIDKYPLMRPVT